MSADNENKVNSNQFMYIIKEFYSQRQNQVLQSFMTVHTFELSLPHHCKSEQYHSHFQC